eukprot:8066616-Alexandrium_andersonii.AAC.2
MALLMAGDVLKRRHFSGDTTEPRSAMHCWPRLPAILSLRRCPGPDTYMVRSSARDLGIVPA